MTRIPPVPAANTATELIRIPPATSPATPESSFSKRNVMPHVISRVGSREFFISLFFRRMLPGIRIMPANDRNGFRP